MAFCSKCGKELKKNIKFCPECGNEVASNKKIVDDKDVGDKVKESVEKVLDTKDTTSNFTNKDIKDNYGFALISYLGIFAFIPYFLGKSSKFVQYHAKQGMNLLIVWGAYIILYNLLGLIKIGKTVTYLGHTYVTYEASPWWIDFPMVVVGILISTIAITGIVYVCQGKAKELPIIGKLKIVK